MWEKVALETQDGDALKDLVLEEIRQVRRKCIQLESVENFQDQRTFASTYLLFVIRKSGAAGNVEFLRGHWDRLVEDLIRWNPYQKHLWNGLSSVTFVPLLKGNTKEVYST